MSDLPRGRGRPKGTRGTPKRQDLEALWAVHDLMDSGVPTLGRLAVHVDHSGRGLGGSLIMDAALRTDALGIGAFALVVDAKDDNARGFYQAHEFILLAGETHRLFLPIATALAALK